MKLLKKIWKAIAKTFKTKNRCRACGAKIINDWEDIICFDSPPCKSCGFQNDV